MGQRT